MTITIQGYKYDTEGEAQTAQTECRVYYGIPITPTAISQEWVDIHYGGGGEYDFWYIRWNDTLNVVLGEPESIILPDPDDE